MKSPESKTFMSVEEFSSHVGISKLSIRKWIRDGKIKAVKPGGKTWLIPRSEIYRLLEETPPDKFWRYALDGIKQEMDKGITLTDLSNKLEQEAINITDRLADRLRAGDKEAENMVLFLIIIAKKLNTLITESYDTTGEKVIPDSLGVDLGLSTQELEKVYIEYRRRLGQPPALAPTDAKPKKKYGKNKK